MIKHHHQQSFQFHILSQHTIRWNLANYLIWHIHATNFSGDMTPDLGEQLLQSDMCVDPRENGSGIWFHGSWCGFHRDDRSNFIILLTEPCQFASKAVLNWKKYGQIWSRLSPESIYWCLHFYSCFLVCPPDTACYLLILLLIWSSDVGGVFLVDYNHPILSIAMWTSHLLVPKWTQQNLTKLNLT